MFKYPKFYLKKNPRKDNFNHWRTKNAPNIKIFNKNLILETERNKNNLKINYTKLSLYNSLFINCLTKNLSPFHFIFEMKIHETNPNKKKFQTQILTSLSKKITFLYNPIIFNLKSTLQVENNFDQNKKFHASESFSGEIENVENEKIFLNKKQNQPSSLRAQKNLMSLYKNSFLKSFYFNSNSYLNMFDLKPVTYKAKLLTKSASSLIFNLRENEPYGQEYLLPKQKNKVNIFPFFPLKAGNKKDSQSVYLEEYKKKIHLIPVKYKLDSFHRSNQDTYFVHRPIVKENQWVEKTDILADNSTSVKGELALGQNILIGYTPWEGYNFEDAVLINERLISEELFTSLHIERYETEIQDTPFGKEILTNQLPDQSSILSYLDKNGIVKIGTWVHEGDVLVGKIAPLIQQQKASAYEKLLYDILGKKIPKNRDMSLRVPLGVQGRVIHIEIVETKKTESFQNQQSKKNKKSQTPLKAAAKAALFRQKKPSLKMKPALPFREEEKSKNSLQKIAFQKIQDTKAKANAKILRRDDIKSKEINISFKNQHVNFKKYFFGRKHLKKTFKNLFKKSSESAFRYLSPSSGFRVEEIRQTFPISNFNYEIKSQQNQNDKIGGIYTSTNIYQILNKKKAKKSKDFDLKSTILKIHIYIAEKRQLQVGDKIAGRHGNKGIVSNVLSKQDMPYLADGTPLDLVLNPLGVPSRMNVGQIFECLLGLAGYYLGQNYKIQPFDERYGAEASRSLVYSKLYEARIKTNQNWLFDPNFPGKTRLFDGRTGQCFEQPVTVGVAYILKLVHLVDEKIHARSTGPYSLVTQQPLRGRSKLGGQRVGEMEVWALEGFGAAYILQELLTIKSDDIKGRNRVMKSILNNEPMKFGTPESFKVLIRELQSLCLNISIYKVNQNGQPMQMDLSKLP